MIRNNNAACISYFIGISCLLQWTKLDANNKIEPQHAAIIIRFPLTHTHVEESSEFAQPAEAAASNTSVSAHIRVIFTAELCLC